MKKTMKRYSVITRLASVAVVCGLTLAFASCANEDLAQNGKATTDDKGLTAFCTGEPATRTTMEADGKFYWEAGDKIWVKDDSGNWKQSSNSPTGKTASFKFLMPGKYTAKSSYEVYYPGKNGNQDQVTISANQKQTEPNTTAHFGASGDCGIAKATRNATSHEFEFALDHKAAYLVFKPYTSNDVLKYCYLTKIEVTSDNDITDTYTLDPTAETNTGALTGTGSGKQIILTTKGDYYGSTYPNGFPLTNTSANLATNGAYMVIKPGTHTLRIRYWVKDVATGVEGVISKTFSSFNYEKNDYYDMTYALNVRNYDGYQYHMWDARNNYWAGHEWDKADVWQPTLDGGWNGDYNQLSATGSDYNKSGGMGRYDAINSCKNAPNANEMAWYVKKGDPRWDDNELWTSMGHLYKGGMWFKTKSYLQMLSEYDVNRSPINIDLRETDGTVSATPAQGPPQLLMRSRYFFVPALGYYSFGAFIGLGTEGSYWTSSAHPDDSNWAYRLTFSSSGVALDAPGSSEGAYTMKFE